MTPKELQTVKEKDGFVATPLGKGKVNGIGNKYTYIYFQYQENSVEGRLIEFPNDQIQATVDVDNLMRLANEFVSFTPEQ